MTRQSLPILKIHLYKIFCSRIQPIILLFPNKCRLTIDKGICPSIPRIIMIVQKIHIVTSFIRDEEIILFSPLEMIPFPVVIGYNSNISPFVVIVGNTDFVRSDSCSIVLLSIVTKPRMYLIAWLIFCYDIDNTTSRLATIKNRTTASNNFHSINISQREIFQIIFTTPIYRRPINQHQCAIFHTTHDNFTGH